MCIHGEIDLASGDVRIPCKAITSDAMRRGGARADMTADNSARWKIAHGGLPVVQFSQLTIS